ncbi:hypothetical protein EGW08_014170 [Elysia chlorotica]|uniref:Uncharacterized protein n=1 Tax=Elysia chlorotica TaxID=188477 RepID=A0A3S0ZG22_ELYCH|nr:hypothetical protein EGW08_014170 [Elysia chlorotica]
MARLLLIVIILALSADLSYQVAISHHIPSKTKIESSVLLNRIEPFGPTYPFGPVNGVKVKTFPDVVVSKRGDNKVDVEVNTDPKGTSGTISGTHTTSGGTTIKGSVTHGPEGTSGRVDVSIPIQG